MMSRMFLRVMALMVLLVWSGVCFGDVTRFESDTLIGLENECNTEVGDEE